MNYSKKIFIYNNQASNNSHIKMNNNKFVKMFQENIFNSKIQDTMQQMESIFTAIHIMPKLSIFYINFLLSNVFRVLEILGYRTLRYVPCDS